MPEWGEVGGGVAGSDAAFVVAKDHVHDPVETVFDRPMSADHGTDRVSQQHQGGDVEARLACDLAVDFALAFDDDDAVQARPFGLSLQPSGIMNDGVFSRFNTAVIAIHRFMRADRRILEFRSFLLVREDFDILAQGSLITLEREDVTGFLLDDLLCDVALAAPSF